jgi:TonB family protein
MPNSTCYRDMVFSIALAVVVVLASVSARANEECSVVTSEAHFPYSEVGLAARNAFLAQICGGANGDIYLPWDARIKDRFERASKGHSSHDQLYPDTARRQNLQGKVVVAVVVERDGSIQHTAVIESSGYAVLDEAAMTWIKKGDFDSPAKLDGQPVRILIYLPIEFKLTTLPKKK